MPRRPNQVPHTRISVYLPVPTKEALELQAQKRGLKLSSLTAKLLTGLVTRQKLLQELPRHKMIQDPPLDDQTDR